MSEAVDKFLNKLEADEKISDYAEHVLGCSERQRQAFMRTAAEFIEWDGVRLLFKTGNGEKISAHDPKCKAFFQSEYDFLLPKPKPQRENVDAGGNVSIEQSLIDAALDGNQTARGKIAQSFATPGKPVTANNVAAADLFLKAQKKGTPPDTRDNREPRHVGGDNPWSAEGWNITKQGQVYRSNPETAERLAKSAGSRIGATHPPR